MRSSKKETEVKGSCEAGVAPGKARRLSAGAEGSRVERSKGVVPGAMTLLCGRGLMSAC